MRCGQCKEVFDASAHLVPSAPPALLPDMSLTDARPPSVPVARKVDAARAWGDGAASPVVPFSGVVSRPVAEGAGFSDPPVGALGGPRGGDALPPALSAAFTPVLDIPSPAVPAFLAAGGNGVELGTDGLTLEPTTPFAWRSPPSPSPAALSASDRLTRPRRAEAAALAIPAVTLMPGLEDVVLPAVSLPASSLLMDTAQPTLRGGYELPFADQRDADWPGDAAAPAVTEAAVESGRVGPERDIQTPPTPLNDIERGPAPTSVSIAEPIVGSLPSVDFVQQPPVVDLPGALALEGDDPLVAELQASSRSAARTREGVSESDEVTHDADQEEVSFVIAARRKAFWRKPAVRIVLVLAVLLSILGLALQVVVQERDHIVALDARARPWLMKLCESLRCEIAPQRQIADVVIDSSSFNKARGDSYQLALTMKSKAAIPLAMPAVELTLTDAQDQPVLRRVLLPTDMAAPAELPARGEWGTSVSVIVTTGGARVAGYRLLAFYP